MDIIQELYVRHRFIVRQIEKHGGTPSHQCRIIDQLNQVIDEIKNEVDKLEDLKKSLDNRTI